HIVQDEVRIESAGRPQSLSTRLLARWTIDVAPVIFSMIKPFTPGHKNRRRQQRHTHPKREGKKDSESIKEIPGG
ncbi:MAG: hypothetical protein QXK96_05715, partial [Candidatus Bathyarchaeia archaeon]